MKRNIRDLIDFTKVDALLEGFSKSSGFVTAIIDLDGNVLSKSGWRKICTDFYRVNSETAKRCLFSDTVLANKMADGKDYHAYKCLNGLIDVAVPLRINGEHVANLFIGQFFFEQPDIDFFKKQAKEYGFDEDKYLDAVKQVPIVQEEKVKAAMSFLHKMTEFISELTIQKLEQTDLNQELRESEQKFKSLFESDNVGKSITSLSGEMNVNKAFAKMLGYNPDELKNKKWQEITPEDDIPLSKQIFDSLLAGEKESARYEKRYNCKNGSFIWADVNISLVKDENGQPLYLLTSMVDITNRKLAEQSLRESEERFFTLFEKSPIVMSLSKLSDGTFVAVNEAFEREFGFAKHEAIGKNSQDLGINPDTKSRQRILEALKSSKAVRDEEIVLFSKSGEECCYEVSIDIVVINEVEYLLNCAQNIREYKRTENKLKEHYNLIRIAGEKAKLGGWSVIVEENRMCWSDEVAAIHEMPKGYSPRVEDGINFYAPEWRDKIIEIFRKCLQDGIPYDEEMEIITATGKRIWVRTIGEAIRNESGNIYKIQGAFQDITLRKIAEEELRKSKHDLEEYFENDISANYVTLLSGEILSCNKTFWALFGFKSKAETEGFDITRLFRRPDERAKMLNKVSEQGKVENYEVEFVSADGKIIYAMINALGIFDKNQKLEKIRGYVVDITEQKRAEIALRESEVRYREFFEADITGDYKASKEGVILDCNPAFFKILGYDTANELIGSNISGIYQNPSERQTFLNLIQKEKTLTGYITKLKRKDGTAIICNENIIGNFDGNGLLVNYFGYMYDITDKIHAEEQLRKHEQLLSSIVDTQQELICRFLPDTTLTFVNKAYCKIFGKTESELIGRKFLELVPESEWDDIASKLNSLNKENPKITYQSPSFKSDGSIIIIEWTEFPIFNEEGEIVEFQSAGRDITEKLKTQNELIIAKEKAEESDRLKTAFLANMSHEIRTPMNGILGFTELLLTPDLSSDKMESYIKIVHQSGQRMLNTVNNIVEISRIEAGLINVNKEDTNLNERVEELIEFFEPEAERKGLKLQADKLLPYNQNRIVTDRNKIDSILTNLIKNALKYTESGTVSVGCQINGSVVEFYVKDTGIGIPVDRQKAIFDRFVQADIEDTRAFEGSGLGLAISKSYVEMLGGTIWVESIEGEGSVFYFTIPVKNSPYKESLADNNLPFDFKSTKVNGLKIIIAEDDEVSRNFLSLIAGDFCSELLEAKTGIEAIALYQENKDVDLILMDIRMPGMDGYEATRRIREMNKDVIIIAQTAYGMQGDKKKAIEAGCNDYIAKPVNKTKLHALIQEYFG